MLRRRTFARDGRSRRLSYTQLAVVVALLVVVAGGTSYAADRYLITSASQIKPSVIKFLRKGAGLRGKPGRRGQRGEAGKYGNTGRTGPTGGTGATGATGVRGPNAILVDLHTATGSSYPGGPITFAQSTGIDFGPFRLDTACSNVGGGETSATIIAPASPPLNYNIVAGGVTSDGGPFSLASSPNGGNVTLFDDHPSGSTANGQINFEIGFAPGTPSYIVQLGYTYAAAAGPAITCHLFGAIEPTG